MAEDYLQKRDGLAAPFNMAIATLMRINEILQNITQVSAMPLDPITISYTKYKMLQQLYLAAVPLIENVATKKKIKEEIFKMKSEFFIINHRGQKKRNCYDNTEERIDSIIETILEALQIDKYFMPPKNDPRYSWKQ